jgi:hypothetical protein
MCRAEVPQVRCVAVAFETLTIHLPVSAARRLRRVAEIARRPVDEVLAETLCASLPPLLEDVPATFQSDLARLETLPSAALHEQMRAVLRPENVTRYETLQAIQAERLLTEAEQQEWETLRLEADSLMFRKAYAAVLLKWRGERVPTLAELEKPR